MEIPTADYLIKYAKRYESHHKYPNFVIIFILQKKFEVINLLKYWFETYETNSNFQELIVEVRNLIIRIRSLKEDCIGGLRVITYLLLYHKDVHWITSNSSDFTLLINRLYRLVHQPDLLNCSSSVSRTSCCNVGLLEDVLYLYFQVIQCSGILARSHIGSIILCHINTYIDEQISFYLATQMNIVHLKSEIPITNSKLCDEDKLVRRTNQCQSY